MIQIGSNLIQFWLKLGRNLREPKGCRVLLCNSQAKMMTAAWPDRYMLVTSGRTHRCMTLARTHARRGAGQQILEVLRTLEWTQHTLVPSSITSTCQDNISSNRQLHPLLSCNSRLPLFCQEWDCAAGSSCKNSVIQGVCFEALLDSDGQVVPWVGSRCLQPAKSMRNVLGNYTVVHLWYAAFNCRTSQDSEICFRGTCEFDHTLGKSTSPKTCRKAAKTEQHHAASLVMPDAGKSERR